MTDQVADPAVVAEPVLAGPLGRHVPLAALAGEGGRAVAHLGLVHEHAGAAVQALGRRRHAVAARHLAPLHNQFMYYVPDFYMND